MRLMVLGASGLIGHKLVQVLTPRFGDVLGVLHGGADRFHDHPVFVGARLREGLHGEDFSQVVALLESERPDVVLNCLGITKRRPEVNDPIRAISVNALLPHLLARWCRENGARLIHFSTDCVFDGSKGDYTEDDRTTAYDAYGRTKALGEVCDDHNLTLRSSFIGRELAVHSELLDWFLRQRGAQLKGFTRALYTGISTREMARIVGDIIADHPNLVGLYQLAMAEPISKYDLLLLFREAFELDVAIDPDDTVEVKANLVGDALRAKIGYILPDWRSMVEGIAAENHLYPTLS
jgi:dTDP-4-dehydrorhamnose reductase